MGDNSYKLDRENIIVVVGDEWDAFAKENGAPSARSSQVLGESLWQFIYGVETRSYLNAIFFACRMDTAPFDILYRCDAPDTKRLFRLSIEPGENGSLILNHSLIQKSQRAANQKVTAFADNYDGDRCSICCSFLIGENWIDAFAHPDIRYFAKSYGVCPTCKAAARAALASRNGRPDRVAYLPAARADKG